MKTKKFTATLLSFAMMAGMCACGNNTAETSEATTGSEIEITFEETTESTEETSEETTVETTVEETTVSEVTETTLYEELSDSLIMYGANDRCGIYEGEGLNSTRISSIEINAEYEVIGVSSTAYYISVDGNIYRVAKTALSNEPVEVEEEPEETEGTLPTDSTDNGNGGSTTPTNPPPEEELILYPVSDTPTTWTTPDGYTVQEYHHDYYGTVYGYYVDASYLFDVVNTRRANEGVGSVSQGDQSYANTRAIEVSFDLSHNRPNGMSLGSLGECVGGSARNDTRYGDPEHYAICVDSRYTTMATSSFIRVAWTPSDLYPDGGLWSSAGGGNVTCFW